MKVAKFLKRRNKAFTTIIIGFILLLPIIATIPSNLLTNESVINLKTQNGGSGADSILWKVGRGMPGDGPTMQPRMINFTEGGPSLIVVGMDEGIATITLDGFINMSYITMGPVIDFEIIEDISGDDVKDIVLITYNKDHPNLIAIASNNGTEIWKFKPTIKGISTENYEEQDHITYSWDIKIVNDITDDSIPEIVISSWYRLYVINGKSGTKVWMNDKDFTNDIWKLEVLEDINNNGYQTIVAGSEEGELIAFDSKIGTKLWSYSVRESSILVFEMFGYTYTEVPNSIDEIIIVEDIDDDAINDVLIAADDGYLRLISGRYGYEIDNFKCYNMTELTSPLYNVPISPYSSIRRIFMKSGIKIYPIPDTDNDGIDEYISISCHLDYGSDLYDLFENGVIQGILFQLDPSLEEKFRITNIINWTYQDFYHSSYPEVITLDNGIQFYFYQYETNYYTSDESLINRFDINDIGSEHPVVVYQDPGEYEYPSYYRETFLTHYLLNIGDINGDGVEDLFAISANGRYLCIDCKNDDIIWVRTNEDLYTEVIEIEDLNNNGFNDFLVEKISSFEPEWSQSENNGKQIIKELYSVDGKSGEIIWDFEISALQYYDGLRDIKNIGDINDDNVDDYASWIIPSTIPPEITQIVKDLSDQESIQSSMAEKIYKSLLSKYIKFLVIDGLSGNIFWNTSLINTPYKFYRHFEYEGSYENPISPMDSGDFQIHNRINEEIDDSWHNSYNLNWDEIWEISSLLRAESIELINGTSTNREFDLWGNQNSNYTYTSYNSSDSTKSLKIGTTSNSTSVGSIESGDNQYWVLNSVPTAGKDKINVELSFNLSNPINSELQNLVVDYQGFLSNALIEQIDMYIFNFSNGGHWNKISTPAINNTEVYTNMTKILNNLEDLTLGDQKLVKIKLEAVNATAFTLVIDKLTVDYIYSYGNYTVKATHDSGSWNAVVDLIVPLNFLDDKLLGGMEFPLSQIERLSAFKMQTKLMVNTSSSNAYIFTYEIYNTTSDKWVICNWDNQHTTWNNHTYPDLKGGFKSPRTNYSDYPLNNTGYQYDHMWIITRGTKDAYPCLEFDYENKTTLSDFINSNKEIRIRINVSNNQIPFDLIIDNFGLGAFYWGLFDNEYDPYYIWKYSVNEWESEFNDVNLLDLEVQSFETINGTGDNYLDIIAVIGKEGFNENPDDAWSSRIRLFDIKNNLIFDKWSLNKTIIPYQNVRILPINNSLNSWIISGIFKFGDKYNCSHKLIENPYWDTQISYFDNYTDSEVAIDYKWEIIPSFPYVDSYSSNLYELPGKTIISIDGKIGIILGKYVYSESGDMTLSEIRIVDINNKSTISIIPTYRLQSLNYYSSLTVGNIDFNLEGVGFKLLTSYEDFNGDTFLDHVGIYKPEHQSNGYYYPTLEVRVYSGNSGDSNPIVLFKETFQNTYRDYDAEYSSKLKMPFSSIGDINNDGISDAIVGFQSQGWDCKGCRIQFYDVHNSNENEGIDLTQFRWDLEPFECLNPFFSYPSYEFIRNFENIVDINGDNYNEILIDRDLFVKSTDEYGWVSYSQFPTFEILDVMKQKFLYRFNLDISSIYPLLDLNGDNKNEILVVSKDILYCINSKFSVQILSPTDLGSMSSHNFKIEWNTEASYDYFEVVVNGVSQGPVTNKNIRVSLSSGWKDINIIMHDKSGLITTINSIRVLVPPNQIQLILTFVILGAIASIYIFYRRYSKRQKEMILIERK